MKKILTKMNKYFKHYCPSCNGIMDSELFRYEDRQIDL